MSGTSAGTAAGPPAWCRHCKEPVVLTGPWQPLPEMRRAVHAATGDEKGPGHGGDGWHAAAPTSEDPVLRAQADALEAEFDQVFRISVLFGFFRADWRELSGVHYEASNGTEMRLALRSAVLSALRQEHGRHYAVGYSEEDGWWAARHGRRGVSLTAQSPNRLHAAIVEDYGAEPEAVL